MIAHERGMVGRFSLNPEHPNRSFDLADVEWMARIIWASQ